LLLLTVRAGARDDLPALVQIHIAGWRKAYTGMIEDEILDTILTVDRRTQQWERNFDDLEQGLIHIFVAEIEGQAVGFAICGKERGLAPEYDGELYAIYLSPDVIGRGIGTALFNRVVQDLRESGFHKMMLWVLKDNHLARTFYEQKGGVLLEARSFNIMHQTIDEVGYGWHNINDL
jgi:GNAT superfamily N-acetyltransferase